MLYIDFKFDLFLFFFHDTSTTDIYTLPTRRSSDLNWDWLYASNNKGKFFTSVSILPRKRIYGCSIFQSSGFFMGRSRSEEHTSELQSRPHLVCCLLLE